MARSKFYHAQYPALVTKTIAFSGAAGNGAVGTVAVFTLTGRVFIYRVMPICTEDLASAGGTVQLGVASDTDAFVASTTATNIDNGNIWVLNADTDDMVSLGRPGAATTVAAMNKAISESVIITVGVANVTDGTLVIYAEWEPITDDGRLVAA